MLAPSHEAFVRGARLFDGGSFFEAHEAWEERWLVETDRATKRLLQGLIQIAAGLHKLVVAKDGEATSRLLAKGLAKLDACEEGTGGIAFARFREAMHEYARAIALGHLDHPTPPAPRPAGKAGGA